MTDCDKPKGRDEESSHDTDELSRVSTFIMAIVNFLNINPQAKIPIYDPNDKQWYTLELNRQRQPVVAMRLPNGAPAIRILDIRNNGFTFSPKSLQRNNNQPHDNSQDHRKKTDPLSEKRFNLALRGMAEDTRVKALLQERQSRKEKITAYATRLAEALANSLKEATVTTNDTKIIFQYKDNVGKDCVTILELLVDATGLRLQRDSATYRATIKAEDFAHFLMEEFINKLIALLPWSDQLKDFKEKIMKIRETLFGITILSTPIPENKHRVLEITII